MDIEKLAKEKQMPDIDAKKTEELLPCPFCGGAAQAEHFESKLGRWRWSIGCNDHTAKADDGGEPAAECYGFQSMTSFATKAEAIAAWNRRATASESEAAALRKRVWEADRLLIKCFNRIHPLPRVSDTELADAISHFRARTALEAPNAREKL